MDQFFYKTNLMGGKLGSFSLSKVIRTIEKQDGGLLVLLDDGHEQPMAAERPVGNKGKVQAIRVREWIQSEIILSVEDKNRFLALVDQFYGNLYIPSFSEEKSKEGKQEIRISSDTDLVDIIGTTDKS